MARLNLLGGQYLARSPIASVQTCINLYAEKNPQTEPNSPYTYLLTPGLTLKTTPTAAVARGLYTATTGTLYYVAGQAVYQVNSNFTITLLGTLLANLTTPVAMQDNGNVLIIVDGTSNGYAINLQNGILGQPIAGQLTNPGTLNAGTPTAGTITAPGSGGTNGSYSGVALTGGAGTGETANVVVSNPFTGFTFSNNGSGFLRVTATTSVAHGLAPTNAFTVAGIAALNHLGGSINLNGAQTAVTGTTGSTLVWDSSLPFTVAPVTVQMNGALTVGGTGELTSVVLIPTGIGYHVNDTLATTAGGLSGVTYTVTAITASNSGTFDVPLTGGSGTGARGLITVVSGSVTDVSLDTAGNNYLVNDVLSTSSILGLSGFTFLLTAVGSAVSAFAQIVDPNFLGGNSIGYLDTFMVIAVPNTRNWYSTLSNVTYAQLTGVPGQPSIGTIINAGTGATNGTYNNVAMTGGSGTGGTLNITVAGGTVIAAVLDPTGLGYNAGDIVSVSGVTGLTNFQYEITQVNAPAFDPTFIASKTGYPDLLAGLAVVHREIWLFGAVETAEVWYDAGGTLFPFQIMPGIFIQHGCIAPASIATHDLDVFWLGTDNAGQGTVYMGAGYRAQKISDWGIANQIKGFLKTAGTISDAVGLVYKQEDHVFYVLTFPSANATLVYDRTENVWHQRTWTDTNGQPNRVRWNVAAVAYGVNVVADWQTGQIYILDLDNITDNAQPIVRTRAFQHLLNDGKRVSYDRFALDLQCGQGLSTDPTHIPLITLQISDDRGITYYTAPMQSMGKTGDYLAQPIWHQLGMARDRVFKVSWSEGVFTALQGAWLDVSPSET